MSGSEIARVREQIELACEAAKLGMNGYALTASHEMINARLETLGEQLDGYQEQLTSLVGKHQALKIIAETYQTIVG